MTQSIVHPDLVEIWIDERARQVTVTVDGKCLFHAKSVHRIHLLNDAAPGTSGYVEPYVDEEPR